MGRPRKWTDDAERKRAYRAARPGLDKRVRPEHNAKKRVRRVFIAIDGEALGESGYHLLAASTGDSVDNGPEGLSSEACLRFLLALKAKYGPAIYCGFALGYDCEHWIRDYGPTLWQSLRATGEGWVSIDGKSYTVQYIPRKWFKIGWRIDGRFIPVIEVFDVFSFFQSSFVGVVGSPDYADQLEALCPTRPGGSSWRTRLGDGWGAATVEEMALLSTWKNRRGAFVAEDWEEICEYNQVECRVLVRLMNKLRDALEEADIHLRSWHGPGAVANFLLKRYNMSEHIASPPLGAADAIARAYFGGRFQVFTFGHIEGVYDYDISSAYPYATTLLPSTQGRWERVGAYQGDEAPWTVYLISWATQAQAGDLTPFPWRDENGCIHYPAFGRGWYWGWEVAAARRRWPGIRIEDGWRLYPVEEDVFEWMNDLAAKRVDAKQRAFTAVGPERERLQALSRVYKLALNSVYGKTIQTVGEHRPFLCPTWAGLITSYTRAKLMEAAQSISTGRDGHLVCFATDGLFSTVPLADEKLGSSLGDWGLEAKNIRLELYQSGCYAIYQGGQLTASRFRGVPRADVPWDLMRKLWRKDGFGGATSIPIKAFIGHRTALQRGDPSLQCTWVTGVKEVSLLPGCGLPQPNEGYTTRWYSAYPNLDYGVVSTRYRKLPPGDMEQEIDEMMVQPK